MENQKLFEYMLHEHGVTLLVGDMHEIDRIVMESHTPPPGMDEIIKRVEGLKIDTNEISILPNSFGHYNEAIDTVLEILRSTPQETCEWSRPNKDQLIAISCSSNILTNNGLRHQYTYCPFCGRKIERV
jgi:hypothetical protein